LATAIFGCGPTVIAVHETTLRHVPAPPPPPTPQVQEVTYQSFYDELSPYGTWIDYPSYGYVWSPSVDASFQPYSTNGHWVYSNEGWIWASDYNWGWAAFHYGRWFYEDGYGWLWKPGSQWAPPWVTWGQSGNYYGWAPLPPQGEVNVTYTPPAHTWVFVPREHINKPNVHDYVVNRSNNTTIIKNVTIINNVTNVTNKTTVVNNVHNTVIVNRGPRVTEVERVTNNHVQVYNINEHNKPSTTVINNNVVNIYRPVIKDHSQLAGQWAPRNVQAYKHRTVN